MFRFLSTRNADEHIDEGDEEAHGDHVDISAAAARSLGLTLQEVTLKDYTKRIHVPGVIVEKPGTSEIAVPSPIQGVVTRIHRYPGESLNIGDLLFTIQVTDEGLEAAQLSMLEILTKISLVESELARLGPLVDSGTVVGRRSLELEYQLKQHLSERAARIQELRLRGLSAEQIDQIVSRRELVNQIEVRLGHFSEGVKISLSQIDDTKVSDSDQDRSPVRLTTAEKHNRLDYGHSMERLNVFPGKLVRKGDDLCYVADHRELLIRADGFTPDLPFLRECMEKNWSVEAEFGENENVEAMPDLKILYLDNQADAETRTFPFYLVLQNEVAVERTDPEGRLYRSWKFKPGQRVHVYVPLHPWHDQFVLPRNAVVRSGPESYVFRLENPTDLRTRPSVAMRLDIVEHAAMWELEPVPVQVLHQDRRNVVIAADGDLMLGDLVVSNRAYQVYLAWRMQVSGGSGGHDHDHDH
ncbi:MAG TPA: hypothetical protein PKD64_09460 [Pirellulaceae bacterium]|nr:hypothetical protein [Pirellulaceae bacterium]HMO92413.1 hypothetical protein [Pirellulaceae bacterium]HMP69532.1 hypothetical protein [Pirellulaceae bacterium]